MATKEERVKAPDGRILPKDGDYCKTAAMGVAVNICFRSSPCALPCRQAFEYSPCCRSFGKLGVMSCGLPGYRRGIMVGAFLMNMFALSATIFAALSLSTNKELVTNTAWAQGSINYDNATELNMRQAFPANFTPGPVVVDLYIGTCESSRQCQKCAEGCGGGQFDSLDSCRDLPPSPLITCYAI